MNTEKFLTTIFENHLNIYIEGVDECAEGLIKHSRNQID